MTENERHRILIVDDEINNIDALYRILAPMYDVVVAKDGQSAIQKAEKHRPDLVLLDVIMVDMTGFEVIVRLKDSDLTRNIPVIFITGLDSEENEEKGLLLGAVDYITKPFNDSIVKARVRTHLQIVEYINTIERLCMMDALTNIPNRRSFNEQISKEWDRAVRKNAPISMLMIDIDHFKRYNDTYGHQQGDVLLKTVASVFKDSLNRSADFVSRWGGEEFAAVLPDTDLEGTLETAERVRKNVQDTLVSVADGTQTSVTISIGVNTEYPAGNAGSVLDADAKLKDIEAFMLKTDKALYHAKETGRNRVQSALSMSP